MADLNGKRLGVIAGTMLDQAANDALDYTIITYYDDIEAEIAALLKGEIDAIVDDEPLLRFAASRDPRLHFLGERLQSDSFAYALRHEDVELLGQLDEYIGNLEANGGLEALVDKWLDGTDAERTMPAQPADDDAGPELRVGVSTVSAPFVYKSGDGVIGFDLELLGGFARHSNRPLKVVVLEFSHLIPSLLEDRVDIIAAGLSVTEERSRIIAFSRTYYDSGVSAMTLKQGAR